MNTKGIGIIILMVLLIGCNQNWVSMQECTKSINDQYYLKECEKYDDYKYHYSLREEYEESLSNTSYIIDRHFNQCVLSNETYYVEFDPYIEWKYDYYGNIESNKSIFERFAGSFGIPIECPESKYLIGYEFCYKKWLGCNETWNYKNGTKENHNFVI